MFDTNPELVIQPFKNGVKLVKPTNRLTMLTTIGDISAMPLLIYFVSHDANATTYVDANHLTRITNIPGNQGYYSDVDLKGININKLLSKETVNKINYHNSELINNTKQMMIYEENGTRLDDLFFGALSFKFPIYNSENKITGIFGISALTDNSTFAEAEPFSLALQRIINTGLIKPNISKDNLLFGREINSIYLSKQEINCLRLLIICKTFKGIAHTLQLSPRTVEHYIENIKYKLNVKTKSELIEKVVQQIFPDTYEK